jgi:acetyl-CoA synthetase
MKISNANERNAAFKQSLDHKEVYWKEIIQNYQWIKPPTQVLSGNFSTVDMKWFEDGILNITENTLDRHLKTQPNKIAVIFESNDAKAPKKEITYSELYIQVCQTAELLTNKGVKKGDVVCLYMSMIPELLISILACARIGAIHSVVFGGFSAKALSERIEDCKAKLIITNDSGYRGDKDLPIKTTVDEALNILSSHQKNELLNNLKTMVWKHSNKEIPMDKTKDFFANNEINPQTTEFKATPMNAEDPLFILYTSGSTGKPKGLVHTTAGYMVWAGETYKNVFQMNKDKDIYWCTADIGWITGHSYISYGPLMNGVTQVIFEGIPTWPDAGRFWQIIEKHKVTHFYTAPTAIRALQAFDLTFVKKSNLSSLKVLGTVGEPINEEAWYWYKKEIGNNNCPIVDTWWQTETGGIMISNMAGITPEKPSVATLPMPGVDAILVDEKSQILNGEAEGHLCIRTPWPGIARTIFGDHERFIQTYFSTHKGFYFTGDGAKRNESGEFRIIGRVDDVVNVSGHRIGTAEVEDVIDENENIIEAAVIGAHHDIKGQCLVAYVITNNQLSNKEILNQVNHSLTEEMGAICKIDRLYQVPGLPKTRSGKIMRRILRKIADGETNFGDISTLLNPEVVDQIIKQASS